MSCCQIVKNGTSLWRCLVNITTKREVILYHTFFSSTNFLLLLINTKRLLVFYLTALPTITLHNIGWLKRQMNDKLQMIVEETAAVEKQVKLPL